MTAETTVRPTTHEIVDAETGELREVDLSSATANGLRDILATEFTVELPKSYKKAQILEVLQDAIMGNREAYEGFIVKPLDTSGTSKNPTELTKEQLAERVAAHKESLETDEAERLRKKAEKSKAGKTRRSWDATPDELRRRTLKLGYAQGVLVWAMNRLKKETEVIATIVSELGDENRGENMDLAREGAIEGYAKAYDQFRMPSVACPSVADDGFAGRIWDEMLSTATEEFRHVFETFSPEVIDLESSESVQEHDNSQETGEEGGETEEENS